MTPDARLRGLDPKALEVALAAADKSMLGGDPTARLILVEHVVTAYLEALAARSVPDHANLIKRLKHCVEKPMRNIETFPTVCADALAAIEALAASPLGADNAQVAPAEPAPVARLIQKSGEVPGNGGAARNSPYPLYDVVILNRAAVWDDMPLYASAPAEPAEGEAVGLIAGTGLTLLKEGYAATVWPVSTGDIQDDTVHRLYTSPDREAATREVVIGYMTEAALEQMLAAKPGWHYHMFAKDQSDPRATVAIRALAQQAKQ